MFSVLLDVLLFRYKMLIYFHHLVVLFFCIIKISNGKYESNLDEVHAIVLARGGSKGIRGKNLVHVQGISILGRAILTIKNSGVFQHIWVSTDSEDIANEALKFGALVHRRPAAYSQDNTSSIISVKEFLNKHSDIKRFALFQCTSIFLKKSYVMKAFELFTNNECVFSVTRSHKLRWKQLNGKVMAINFNPNMRPRRQDWDGELVENGMFYLSSRALVSKNIFQNERCAIVEIASADSLEIDTFSDVILARCIDDNNKTKKKKIEL